MYGGVGVDFRAFQTERLVPVVIAFAKEMVTLICRLRSLRFESIRPRAGLRAGGGPGSRGRPVGSATADPEPDGGHPVWCWPDVWPTRAAPGLIGRVSKLPPQFGPERRGVRSQRNLQPCIRMCRCAPLWNRTVGHQSAIFAIRSQFEHGSLSIIVSTHLGSGRDRRWFTVPSPRSRRRSPFQF